MMIVCALTWGIREAAAQSLPSGWTSQDIGSPAVAGSASVSSGTWTISGAGTDIWGTSDQFRFTYRQMSGDIDITVRVASIEALHSWTKAGLMVREGLAGNARHVHMLLTANEGYALQRRATTGGTSEHTYAGSGVAPRWLRLVRKGNTFTGYRSADGVNWTQAASTTLTLPSSVYVGMAVTSHVASDAAKVVFTNLNTASALPAPWQNRDIGNPAPAGSSTSTGTGGFTVSGGGTDIWDLSDQFQFMYQPITGDAEVFARVTSLQYTHEWAKAGVMIRESLDPTSRHMSFFATAASGWSVQYRTETGGTSFDTPGPSGAAPGWVRLVRRGNTFTAYSSPDGATWTTEATNTISMASTVYVGLAVTSHNSGTATSASFTNVTAQAAAAAGNQAPSLSFVNPSASATFTAPASILIEASAADSDGTIARVDLYRGTTMLKSDVTTPYSYRWDNVPAGTYTFNATAVDNDGATTTRSVSVTVNPAGNQPPTVALTSPTSGASYSAPATIGMTASASDGDGSIARVEFYRGTTLISTDTTSPYTASWGSVPAGSYTLTARAYDNGGASTTSAGVNVTVSTSSNQLPSVSITSPTSGASYAAPASVAVTANATDADGTIARVDFYVGTQLLGSDTSAPFTAAWSNVAAGSYSLTAVARDNAGGTRTSAAVSITVSSRPTSVAFTPSADHSTTNVTSYVVALYRSVDPITGTPVATRDLGKPTPVNGTITVDITTLVDPLPSGTYYGAVRAVGPGGTTSSTASATFTK
ncbi:MAG TPA: Ig-like domain-containing protein [Vicinamibacterales bacterium]|nr:Ig-like domain-containing protein [Vicinamibacterales bacterium]